MPSPDPTGPGSAIALDIPAPHSQFLCRTFTTVRDGLLADLAEHSARLRDAGRSRREADAFGRLLSAVEDGACVPDPEMRSALADLARSVDEANEYERVVVEHDALHGLIDQIDSAPHAPRRKGY